VRVNKEPVVVQESEIEEALQQLLEDHAEWIPPAEARPARLGDMVTMDVTGVAAGRTFYTRQNMTTVLSEEPALVAPGLATAIAGTEAGMEKKITLTLPEDFHVADLRGQPAEFTVTVHEIKEKRLLPLDDAFAKSLGDYPSLAALREEIRQRLEERKKAQAEADLAEAVIQKVVECSQVEFPPSMLKRELEILARRRAEEVHQKYGLDWQTYLRVLGLSQEDYYKTLEPVARSRLQRFLVLQKVGEAESITLEPQELAAEVEKARKAKGEASGRRQLSDKELQNRVSVALLTQKALDRLVAIATADDPVV